MMTKTLALAAGLACWASAASAQATFEQTARDLASPDSAARLQAVRTLKAAGSPEAAVPLAAVVVDPEDEVQYEAIAAELNIFLAEAIIPKKRVAFVVEVRDKIDAEAAFRRGPFALNARTVPVDVVVALLRAARDENPRVGLEALYAFGALADEVPGAARRELLRVAGPGLTGMLGVPRLELRVAAARVIGRAFARRRQDPPVDEIVGDAVVMALNDRQRDVRLAAIEALGAMRYERGVRSLIDLHQYYRRNGIGAAALEALSRIGHGSSIPLFQAELAGRGAVGKIVAIEGLARVGDAGWIAEIRAALGRERNESVLLAQRFADVALADGSLEPLLESLAKPRLRDQAMRYLIEVAPGHSAAFRGRSQDPVARLRADVADVLGVSRDPSALAIVEPMAKDPDPQVTRAAERASARLRRLP